MIQESEMFSLQSRTPGVPAPVLAGVQAAGRLDGLLFELTLRQTYHNHSDEPLEVVYTFPLPMAAVLLGFASELDGVRQASTVVEKRRAERRYEAALAQGDAPVMLEARRDGIHTANIGNLKPGQVIVLELRLAQLLAFEQGRLRLALPMTIAPRHGSPAAAGLQPQQLPEVDLLASHALHLALDVMGPLADAAIDCPTHALTRTPVEGGVRLALAQAAWLDRDLVLLLRPREPQLSLQIRAPDVYSAAAPHVVMAALQPPVAALRKRIALKLLVDCSGSMAGDSIASARAALLGLLEHLQPRDYISLTRFGSQVDPQLRMVSCHPQSLAQARAKIQAMAADLGGTEMDRALRHVVQLPLPGSCAGADVLLLTDGEVWEVDDMIRFASACAHRVFVIGVGSSPAEAPLRALAEATGGACEFATPGEQLEAAAARMLVRIRQHPRGKLRIDWGGAEPPVWQTTLPRGVFGGDMVVAFAGLAPGAAAADVQLLEDADAPDGRAGAVEAGEADRARLPGVAGAPAPQPLATAAVGGGVPTDTLARLAAQRRILQDEALALPLALSYQLLGEHTNCVLVHQREAADQVLEAARLHRVPSMPAAGWGALGSISPSVSLCSPMSMADVHADAFEAFDLDDADLGDVMGLVDEAWSDPGASASSSSSTNSVPVVTLEALARAVAYCLFVHADVDGLDANVQVHTRARGLHVPAEVLVALREVEAAGVSRGVAWLLLAGWVRGLAMQHGPVPPQEPGDQAILKALAGVDEQLQAACAPIFRRHLGDCVPHGEAAASARARRLSRALGRAG
ncbi:MAG: hypothetical protein RLZZ584_1791 [Pseudomonadota bacterium]